MKFFTFMFYSIRMDSIEKYATEKHLTNNLILNSLFLLFKRKRTSTLVYSKSEMILTQN